MLKGLFIVGCALAFLGSGSFLRAELTFEATKKDAPARLGQPDVVVVYDFENTGNKAISITEMKTSCGCTAAKLDKRTYAPGETGQISLTFATKGRTGKQHLSATLMTDNSAQPNIVLELHTQIPQFASVSPRLLVWNGTNEPKVVIVRFAEGAEAKIVGLIRENRTSGGQEDEVDDGWDVQIAEGAAENEYVVRITPKEPLEPRRAVWNLEIESPHAQEAVGRFTVATIVGSPAAAPRLQDQGLFRAEPE